MGEVIEERDCSGDAHEIFTIAAKDAHAHLDLDERTAAAQEKESRTMLNADFLEAVARMAEDAGMDVFDFIRKHDITSPFSNL